jgi:hypothetical protein
LSQFWNQVLWIAFVIFSGVMNLFATKYKTHTPARDKINQIIVALRANHQIESLLLRI